AVALGPSEGVDARRIAEAQARDVDDESRGPPFDDAPRLGDEPGGRGEVELTRDAHDGFRVEFVGGDVEDGCARRRHHGGIVRNYGWILHARPFGYASKCRVGRGRREGT